jgi:hypothetical protein
MPPRKPEEEHRRWNTPGFVGNMDYLRECLGSGADSLNWLVPYSLHAWCDGLDHEPDISQIGQEYDGHPVQGNFEGYLIMPRVGGVSRVDVLIDTAEDALYVAESVNATMLAIIADGHQAAGHADWLRHRVKSEKAKESANAV